MIVSMHRLRQERNRLHCRTRASVADTFDFGQVTDGIRGRVQVGEKDLIFVYSGASINCAYYQTKDHNVNDLKHRRAFAVAGPTFWNSHGR